MIFPSHHLHNFPPENHASLPLASHCAPGAFFSPRDLPQIPPLEIFFPAILFSHSPIFPSIAISWFGMVSKVVPLTPPTSPQYSNEGGHLVHANQHSNLAVEVAATHSSSAPIHHNPKQGEQDLASTSPPFANQPITPEWGSRATEVTRRLPSNESTPERGSRATKVARQPSIITNVTPEWGGRSSQGLRQSLPLLQRTSQESSNS